MKLKETMAGPTLSYELHSKIEVWLGYDLFYGTVKGLFGQFDGKDRVLVGI
ncbi:hypothetical protein MYX84_14565 [Acidobacteria bacterium AH-259-O06]|nr:hypothetical protein [Acidobacteria bacterium AH-259-O06]